MDYFDNEECKKLIEMLLKNPSNKELTEEFCKFRCDSADDLLRKNLQNPTTVHILCESRSDAASDEIAGKLEMLLDDLEERTAADNNQKGAAWMILTMCHFKQSPRMFRVFRRIARDAKAIRRKDLQWRENSLDESAFDGQPPLFAQRFGKEKERGSEYTFLNMLQDIMITSARDSVVLYGDKSEYAAEIRDILEQYPDSFRSAGFALDLMEDSSKAYDKWIAGGRISGRDLAFVTDGVYISKTKDGFKFFLGTPVLFTGRENEKFNYTVELADFDRRFITYMAEEPYRIKAASSVKDANYNRAVFYPYSRFLVECMWAGDESHDYIADYFEKSIFDGGSGADMDGIAYSGRIKTPEMLCGLFEKLARRICSREQDFILYRLEERFERSDSNREIPVRFFEKDEIALAHAHAARVFMTEDVPFVFRRLAEEYIHDTDKKLLESIS